MASEEEKGKVEISIFKRFAAAAGLNCEYVEKQSPEDGKPDLKCLIDGEVIFFELTEACSEDVAKAIANPRSMNDPGLARAIDYTSETYKKKIAKRYAVSEPIELLIYNVGRTLLSDDVLIDNIRAISDKNKGPFRKVWYFGEHVSEL
ncbi:hypothetical protein SAMN04487880_1943 [Marinobacter sp. es.042]|jgi:hypothetical protein|uniref:hypothetical protein n=1 Tax=unclassified Marinobacter TaxID=83889 RepID=UPI000B50E3BA|nr:MULTISPECIES: hypothetical protein [unclassified Marinobacter]TYC59242.1 hypothetical protein FMN52_06960 [Marinobacter sp. BW6]SNB57074.1 hypothetical protein SAMN04487880_1943 [Marinobacter sp. es.042]